MEKEGYCPAAISDHELDLAHFNPGEFDLAILNLYPDSMKTWDIYYDVHEKFPDFPVLVYLIKNIYSLRSLKLAIKEILNNQSSQKLTQKGFSLQINSYTNQYDPVII